MPANILVIMTDQQWAGALSGAGNPDLRTPALDALAADGTRFRRAYCTSPLCAPSRASMITGRLPSQLGVDDNVSAAPTHFPADTLGRIFADTGYDCGYGGKWHAPEQVPPPERGFEQVSRRTHGGLAEDCARFLEAPERQRRPFLLVASFNEPHGICEWARGQRPPSGELPEVGWRDLPPLPGNFAPGTEEAEAPRLVQQWAWLVHPTATWDAEQWRRYRHAYYRLCERADAEIGKLITALDRSGHRDNTMIVFTSDHGDGLGAHGWNQKKLLIEEVVGVPFVVVPPRAADPPPGGAIRDELVSVGLDLLPTLCDYAGIARDDRLTGRSVRPLVEAADDHDTRWRDQVVVETVWRFPGLMPPPNQGALHGRMLRTDRFGYVCYSWGRHREQLFDLEADPGQLVNLATSGRHQPTLDHHRHRLTAHAEQFDDAFLRFVPTPGSPPR